MAMQVALPWHDGELQVHRKLGGPGRDNPNSSVLLQQGAILLQSATLLAIGTVDDQSRPWTTIWGGEPGFARPLGASMVGIKTPVDSNHDAVLGALGINNGHLGEESLQQMAGKPMGGLTIDLNRRKRVKLAGKMVAGAVAVPEDSEGGDVQGQIQLVTQIEQSLGNCPKYLNRKDIKPAQTRAKLISSEPSLSERAMDLIHKADLFFISSIHATEGMDTNHRGGAPGFTRVTNDTGGNSVIVWPEYSGNKLYQTLGNLEINPMAGLVFPDFDTGDVLYLTGQTETLFKTDANALIPKSNLAVKLTVTGAKLVQQGLPFRGSLVESSPYNPRVRPLASETRFDSIIDNKVQNSVKMLERVPITPTVSRFKFSLNNPTSFKAGQWVALDFSEELDIGYSHMRDDDPTSLNDDFVRTFTVSSPPPPQKDIADDNFEITARRVGTVTSLMFQQSSRSSMQIPIRGFGGDFLIRQNAEGLTPFIAGGVGITPVLAFLPELDMSRFILFWTLHIDDVNLVVDTVQRCPDVAASLQVFLTGIKDLEAAQTASKSLTGRSIRVEYRRLEQQDIQSPQLDTVQSWHICVGTGLRKTLLQWLDTKEVLFEDFNF